MKQHTAQDPSAEKTPRPSRSALLIERAPLPMVEVEGPEHVVCFVNAAFCELLGKTREELVGQRFSGLICNGPKCAELLDRVCATGQCETHASADDTTPAYWLYAMWPALDDRNQPERVIIQLTRATQFRQNAAALNEALLLSGLRQHDLRVAAEASNASLALENAERRRVETELHTAHVALRASADQLEETVGARTTQLRASMAELEAFAYSLAHDLRAPVRAIHGFTQFALELPREELGPKAADLLRRVLKAATRMDSLIQDVLNLSHVIQRPIVLGSVDVDGLVKALVEERPELSSPRAEVRIESPLLQVLAHEATLSQCLTNLLSNAVKFVEPGVVPRVQVRTEEIAGANGRPMVRIWVEDEGVGIDPKDHDRIFEIFQRLNTAPQYEGTGIGLAIVRKATERMGGRCGLNSARQKGSQFWLEFPKA
jgi:signal transduction histidine kinase